MRKKNLLFLLGVCCLTFLLPLCAQAGIVIQIDEDFEDAEAFTDLNWPESTSSDSYAATPANLALRGINIAYLDGFTTLPHATIVNPGALATDRYFGGLKSLKLTTGQKLEQGGDSYYGRERPTVYQFAIGAADVATSAGTQIGHFKIQYSTNSTTDLSTEMSYQLNFKTSTSKPGMIDIVSNNSNATISSFYAVAGYWANITVLTQPACSAGKVDRTNLPWGAIDGTEYKGPVYETAITTWTAQLKSGITVYVNSKPADQPNEWLGVKALDPTGNWGNDGTGGQPDVTAENGWEIQAENGGIIYVDDMYRGDWGTSILNGQGKEIGTRLNAFNKVAVEPKGQIPAASETWFLY